MRSAEGSAALRLGGHRVADRSDPVHVALAHRDPPATRVGEDLREPTGVLELVEPRDLAPGPVEVVQPQPEVRQAHRHEGLVGVRAEGPEVLLGLGVGRDGALEVAVVGLQLGFHRHDGGETPAVAEGGELLEGGVDVRPRHVDVPEVLRHSGPEHQHHRPDPRVRVLDAGEALLLGDLRAPGEVREHGPQDHRLGQRVVRVGEQLELLLQRGGLQSHVLLEGGVVLHAARHQHHHAGQLAGARSGLARDGQRITQPGPGLGVRADQRPVPAQLEDHPHRARRVLGVAEVADGREDVVVLDVENPCGVELLGVVEPS